MGGPAVCLRGGGHGLGRRCSAGGGRLEACWVFSEVYLLGDILRMYKIIKKQSQLYHHSAQAVSLSSSCGGAERTAQPHRACWCRATWASLPGPQPPPHVRASSGEARSPLCCCPAGDHPTAARDGTARRPCLRQQEGRHHPGPRAAGGRHPCCHASLLHRAGRCGVPRAPGGLAVAELGGTQRPRLRRPGCPRWPLGGGSEPAGPGFCQGRGG